MLKWQHFQRIRFKLLDKLNVILSNQIKKCVDKLTADDC